ncbi:unnamed protein product [Nesidiocoris tenuis]|uniref:Uncharacterized protein n=2 Tax=Nesidiocoris tenuis TaxID=355587 RepID=A0A6H5HTW2_9HEMI|nr:unnamed protein product [Nesidiocoris tenuis]
MFLGGIPKNGINFMAPAGLHRARWMAKGIYAIKVYMFRGEFKMTKKEEVAITELCMFVVSIYVYHWFQAPSCRFAPRNDLKLLKDLKAYNKVNEAIAEVALKKFSGHLWYLSEVLVAFAFFDENVPLETKTKMVQALENEGQEDTLRRITIDSRTYKISNKSSPAQNGFGLFWILKIVSESGNPGGLCQPSGAFFSSDPIGDKTPVRWSVRTHHCRHRYSNLRAPSAPYHHISIGIHHRLRRASVRGRQHQRCTTIPPGRRQYPTALPSSVVDDSPRSHTGQVRPTLLHDYVSPYFIFSVILFIATTFSTKRIVQPLQIVNFANSSQRTFVNPQVPSVLVHMFQWPAPPRHGSCWTTFTKPVISGGQKFLWAFQRVENDFCGSSRFRVIKNSGLPDDYRPMIMGLENSGIKITGDSVKIRILQDVKLTGDTDSALLAARRRQKSSKWRQNDQRGNSDSRQSKPPRKKKQPIEHRASNGAFSSCFATSINDKNAWYLDSGASSHITHSPVLLNDKRPSSQSIVTVADRSSMQVTCKGTANIRSSPLSGRVVDIKVHNVLHIPEAAANLLSISKTIQRGNSVVFNKDGVKIRDNSNRLIVTASLENGIYRLDTVNVPRTSSALALLSASDFDLWHRRTGHLNYNGIERLKKCSTGIDDVIISKSPCEICLMGKQARFPFPRSEKRKEDDN